MHDDDIDQEFGARIGLALKERTALMTAPTRLDARLDERQRHRRRRRVAVRAGALAATVVAIVVGAVAVVDRPSSRRIEPAGVADAATEPGWYLPTEVDGLDPFFAQVLGEGLTFQEKFRIVLARPIGGDVLGGSVTVALGSTARLWVDPAQGGQYVSEPVTAAGFDGLALHDAINDVRIVEYEIGDGRAIVITASTATTTPVQSLMDVAAALDVTGPRTLAVTRGLPDGYQVVQEGDTTGSFGPAMLMDFVGTTDNQRILEIESQPAAPPGSELLQIMETLEPVVVGGRPGWYTTSSPPLGPGPIDPALASGAVIWRATDGAAVRVGGSGSTREQLLRIAEGLKSVSREEWLASANTFPSTGPGLDGLVPSPPVALAAPPDGYRLVSAQFDQAATADGDVYASARYESTGSSTAGQVLEIRLVRTSPEAWQQALDTTYVGNRMWTANGRDLIDVGPRSASGGALPSHRTVAFQWIKGVVVEFDASTADGSALDTMLDFDGLREIANSVNQYPDVYGTVPPPDAPDVSTS